MFYLLINIFNILENFQRESNKKYLQESCKILVENELNIQGKYFGRTQFMTPVIFDSENCKPGELINIKVSSFNQNNLFGFHKLNKVKAA